MSEAAAAHAWKLIALSSLVTVVGSCTIYVDVLWNAVSSRQFSILQNRQFLIASLGLSGGVLITTALNSLLNNALKYFKRAGYGKLQSNQLLLASVVTGVVLCAMFNFLVHTFTSRSIVHCAHGNDETQPLGSGQSYGSGHAEHEQGHGHGHGQGHGQGHGHSHSHDGAHPHPHSHSHSHSHGHGHHADNELAHESARGPTSGPTSRPTSGPTPGSVHTNPAAPAHAAHPHAAHPHDRPRRLRQFVSAEALHQIDHPHAASLIDKLQNHPNEGECRGFESIYHCAAELHVAGHNGESKVVPGIYLEDAELSQHEHDEHDPAVHHHHVTPRASQFLSIGLQTAFAITVHKLPEGFLLFATNRQDKDTGWSVFLALAIHNFFEGFTIACPLYLALENRFLAVASAAVLGGGSQPLGALIASLLFTPNLDSASLGHFGFLVGSTAGFMTVISLQMLSTAVSYGGSSQSVVNWAILGILVVLATRCF